jgi:hypothetical protein
MRRTFLIHALATIYLAAETTWVGVKAEVLPTVQFLSWEGAEVFFVRLGATKDALVDAKNTLDLQRHTQLIV